MCTTIFFIMKIWLYIHADLGIINIEIVEKFVLKN